MTHLAIRNVTRRFNGVGGITGIDLDIARREAVCLLGASGCGKTTLLRVVAGLLIPEAGTVSLNGKDVTDAPPHVRDIGMVFQTWALFPHLTVRKNLEFGLVMRGLDRAERDKRVDRMLALVGMEAMADRKPAQLSGGQQQRVALTRALVINPDVLLLDEPLSSLDFNLRVELRRELRNLQQELGVTAIYVTHDYSEALAVADRTVVMRDGRIVEQGPTKALFERPTTEFAARFLGLHNLLPAKAAGGGTVALGDGHQAAIPAGSWVPQAGEPVQVCFDQWGATLSRTSSDAALAVAVTDTSVEHGFTRVNTKLERTGEMVSIRLPGIANVEPGPGYLTIDWSKAWLVKPG